ncbi:protein of unknown function UPF0001 [Desulfovibrio sp. X2]|uniref:YggS family pyridoxal phosphate-dependent enzyme n=1 Tax=Desulfovibrio sp. X2 TaxID=941449 RepID=UPI0003586FB9|nr:YggS family pyridoxal phosphate-dependent enzyme [Desulfovibrio sp. X2]EPR44033.1 protein of unknown function UPF0001 [Desulfovibrio sp. X2]
MSGHVDAEALVARWREVREAVKQAALSAGRRPEEVRLVAVSKTHPAEAVRILAAAGQHDFGESYVQEALAKKEELRHIGGLRWHFIGGLQTNKAKFVAGAFGLVHSVDSLKLAQALHKRAAAEGTVQDVLVQVNLAGETQKRGAASEAALALVQGVLELPALAPKGLMILPPWDEDPERSRPYFRGLRELRDELQERLSVALPELSMGMTNDFVQAVEEGATLVRVGTRIFGERPPR